MKIKPAIVAAALSASPVADAVSQTTAPTTAPAAATAPAQQRRRERPATVEVFPPEVHERLRQLGKRDQGIHDPSTIVKCGDEYWIFATGNGVASMRSKDLITWREGPPIWTQRPSWTLEAVPGHRGGEQGHYWAPDVIFHNGRYLVYYSVSTFGRNTSAIALASNATLNPDDPNFKWVDEGIVIRSRRGESDFNAIDPAIIVDNDGRMWMSFGSFWTGIKLIELDPKTGLRIAPDSPVHSIAYTREIEAPFIYSHDNYYYLFVNWGICCRGVNSTYNMRVGRSRSITGPYLDKQGRDMAREGGTLLLETDGPFIGPGHPGIFKEDGTYWFSMHFYDPTNRGHGMLAIRRLTWDADGWPVVGER